jgi:histidine triad (HIT) family protein
MNACIFCDIAARKSPAHIIWEDDLFMAFLSIFPNTPGFTVVIPKAHHGSYFADVKTEVVDGLIRAVRTVAQLLDRKLPDVGRTGVMFEGFGVDHLHAKLFPMHRTKMGEWRQLKSNVDKFFEHYEGYISSHDYQRADDKILEALARTIRS